MGEESLDFLQLPDNSEEEEERLAAVQTVLECLQGLTDHIACLEQEHIAESRINKKNKTHFDLGLIRYQLWLSAAFQKITAVGRELEWKHNEWYSPGEDEELPDGYKSILDESLNDGLAVPLEPERLWVAPSWEVKLPPRIMKPKKNDFHVITDKRDKIKTNDYKNQVDSDEFRKKVDELRKKLVKKEKDSVAAYTFDPRAGNLLTNLKSLEENMSELKHLLTLLEKDIEVSPSQCVVIRKWYIKEVMELKRLTENLKYEVSSKKEQFNDLKMSVNSQKQEAKRKIFHMQSWYEKFLKKKCIYQEQKVRALQTLTKMKEEADEMCGHIKKQCDEYVTELEASKKKFEDAVGQQNTLNKRLTAVIKNKNLKTTWET